jgi:hypothetical protein
MNDCPVCERGFVTYHNFKDIRLIYCSSALCNYNRKMENFNLQNVSGGE